MKSILLLTLLLPALSLAGYTRINQPNPDDPMDVHIYQLDNGLTVYLTQNRETPRFYAEIAVRAGSKHDPAETTGLAHYLEHLLFKGNQSMGTLDYDKEKPHLDRIVELYEEHFKEDDPEKRKQLYEQINAEAQKAAQWSIPNEFDKLYNAMGASAINAHTSQEETVYKASMPRNRLEHWCRVEASRFTDPVFRLFHTELETVYEEKNRAMDNKGRILNAAVYDKLFKEHPYGQQTTLGDVEHLKRPSLVNIQNFFETYYVPNNMAICISGDIEIKQAIKTIDQHFSAWKRKPLPELKTWEEKPLNGVERVSVNYQGEEFCMLAWRTVKESHPDADPLALVDMILDNSAAGLINLNLNQQQRVRQAGSYPWMLNDHGIQHLYGVPKKDQSLEEVEQLLRDQLEIVKKGGFDDWILPAIITDFKKSQKAQLESDTARVAAMRSAFIAYEEWDRLVGQIDRMEKLGKKDVVRVANKYFGDNYVAGYRLDAQHEVPSIEKPKIDAINIDPTRQSDFVKSVLAMPVKDIEPSYIEEGREYQVVDEDGIRFYYAKNPLNDLFSFQITVEVGTRHNKRLGMVSRLLDKSGTPKYTPSELKKEWYKLGSSFGFRAGTAASSFVLSGLDENFGSSMKMMKHIIDQAHVEAETLDVLKQIVLAQREDAKKNPDAIAQALSEYNRFGKESTMLNLLPSAELKALEAGTLYGDLRGLLEYNLIVSYTGSLPEKKVRKMVKKFFPSEGERKAWPPYPFVKMRKFDQSEIYLFDKELAQTRISIEFADGEVNEANRVPSRIYNNYFGAGMSSVVFQELREARALAYSAYAYYMGGNRSGEENRVLGGIGTQADKTMDALSAFIELFDNLPVSEERFREAQASIVNRYRTSKIGFRDVIGAARTWEVLGLDGDPRKQRFEKVQAATLETMLDFHKEHIKGRPKLISMVGDASKVDMEKLAKFGKITKVSVDQIFVD